MCSDISTAPAGNSQSTLPNTPDSPVSDFMGKEEIVEQPVLESLRVKSLWKETSHFSVTLPQIDKVLLKNDLSQPDGVNDVCSEMC